MATPRHAVFLSYASEDAAAAELIASALRSAGIEVWFDQSELRGGEAWDREIRKKIHDCALFIPVISANAHARDEGYFRLEWKLAADRSHLMAPDKTFLMPVVIDNTPQTDERIPDRFRELQWSRAPDGQVPLAFVDRIQRLLSPLEPDEPTSGRHATRPLATPQSGRPVGASWGSRRALWVAAAAMVFAALAYLAIDKFPHSRNPASPPRPPAVPANSSVAPGAFSPPPHSIAVLPFVNMSGDKEQDYFSDGLSEELLNSLARINELQVAARTSSFSFKGKDTDIGTIARKLNVGAVLEGSVRRSGHTLRITAQLNNAITGFHLWSQTYDRSLGDVLTLQTEIATAVANALRITLLADAAANIQLGGTRNAAAFDAYLRASKAYEKASDAKGLQDAIAAYSEAINLDPNYALAYADRSTALLALNEEGGADTAFDKARLDARRALELAPELAEAHLALGQYYYSSLNAARANEEYERALALAPGNVRVLRSAGHFAAQMGRFDAGISAVRRAAELDRLNPQSYMSLAGTLLLVHHPDEALTALQEAARLDPDNPYVYVESGRTNYLIGNFETARSFCEMRPDFWPAWMCLTYTYHRLGRHADAEAMLAKVRAKFGDEGAYGYIEVYAQWGNIGEALRWAETALRQRDTDLLFMKTDPLLDPLRKEPRFQAIERALNFPN